MRIGNSNDIDNNTCSQRMCRLPRLVSILEDAAIPESGCEHGPERDKDHARGDDNKVRALSVLEELQSLSRCRSKTYGIPCAGLDEEEVKRDTQLSDLPHAFNDIVTF